MTPGYCLMHNNHHGGQPCQYCQHGEELTRAGITVAPRYTLDARDAAKRDVIRKLLGLVIGEDVNREGLHETPDRVVKAWEHWTSGYNVDISALFKTFEDGSEGMDEMVLVRNIPIHSHCEHHLAPITGHAHIAYIPGGRGVVGLSKLSRVADAFARRLQVQERMTNQIADAIQEHLQPKGCGVIIEAAHGCMSSRGVSHPGNTTTSALRGCFKEGTPRAEFLALTHLRSSV